MTARSNEGAPAVRSRGAGGVTGKDAVPAENCTTVAAVGNPPAGPMLTLPPPLAALAEEPTFCLYKTSPHPDKPGKLEKRPCNYLGEVCDAQDPANHMTAELACQWAAHYGPPYGVAKVFPKGGKFFFLDIDNCMQPDGQWLPLAQTMFQRFAGCAIEVSASGRGVHIFGRGPVPEHGCRNTALGLELYTEGRFVALTGTGAVGDAGHAPDPAAIRWLVDSYFPPRAGAGGDRDAEWTDGPCAEWRGPTDDDDLLRRALRSQSNRSALLGTAGFADLWEARDDVLAATYPADGGSSSGYNGSSADAALAQHLAFWTGRDCARIERLMRRSALHRQKWDDRDDYLPRTILNACRMQRDVLQDREVEPAVPTLSALLAVPTGLATSEASLFVKAGEMFRHYRPAEYLIDGFIEQQTTSLLFGESTAGKSFLMIDWACCIATGKPWKGRKTTAGPVFYIAGEGHNGFCRRLRAWEIVNRQTTADAPLYFSTRPAALMNPESAKEVIDAVQSLTTEYGKPALIVVDTLHRNFGGGDENSSSDFGLFMNHLDVMRTTLDCAIVVVHHTGHGDQARSRGSSSIKASMDHEYRITVEPDKRRLLTCTKMKDGREPEPLYLDLRQVELDLLNANGQPDTSAVLIADANQEPAVKESKRGSGARDTLREAIHTCGSTQKEIVRKKFYTMYPGTPDARQKAFTRAWDEHTKSLGGES